MKTMKRFLTLFFVVLLICTSVPVSFAAITTYGRCGSNLEWTLDSNGTLTISGTGEMYGFSEEKNDWIVKGWRVISEDSSDGGPVWKNTWKEYNDKIKKIVIKNGVTSIGSCAFSYIHHLTSVTIPGSVTRIGEEAFYDCWSLKSIVIPEGVQSIEDFAFGNCDALGNVYLPVSLKKLAYDAFFVWDMALPISTKHHVYYAGSKAQWNKIVITGDKSYFNSVFKGVTMHYNSQNTSSGNNTTNTASITLDQTKITVYQGTSATLKATVTGKSSNVTWKSSNTKIATVSNGKITGKAPGSCKITATANGKSATCKVVVKSPTIDLNKTSTQIYKDCTRTLKATVKGASQKVKWVSNNTKIATVSSKGVITAKKTGTCNITATANGVNAICEVTVLKPKVVLNKNSTTLYAGAERTIKAKIYGKETKAKWSSSNEFVATVNQNGCITGVKEGNCVVTATANGVKAKCKVTVLKPTITLDKSNLSLFVNSCYLLKATVKGKSNNVTWKTSNDSVAKVNNEGMVDAVGAGTCTITATANGYSATCEVIVTSSTLTISNTQLKMYPGMKIQLTAKAVGESSNVTWKSLTPLYASVDQTGLVTANTPGTCYIQASANGVTKNCQIIIMNPYITLKESDLTLYITKEGDIAETGELNITEIFGPSQQVKWKSSDQNIATVRSGVVTAVNAGTCAITASTIEATSEKCMVTVEYAPEYSITYYLDGGKNSLRNPNKYTHITPTFSLEDPTRDGYDFTGWMDENNQPVEEIQKGSKGNLTLFATWQPKTQIIAPVDLNNGQWYAIAYPGHWKPEPFQFYATDWNCYANGDWNYDAGQYVYAIADGQIEYSSVETGSIRIRHTTPLYLKNGETIPENTWFSWYGHMHNIKQSGYVKQGEVIGTIGNASASNYHLHFSVYAANEPWGSPAYGISPYWIAGPMSNGNLYADDIYGTREGVYQASDLPEGYEIYNGRNVYDAILDDSRMPS